MVAFRFAWAFACICVIKHYILESSTVAIEYEPVAPCSPSPCGANAVCRERNGAGACTCLEQYFGDPYVGCRPECVMNEDCPYDRACAGNKCRDPCPGTCGLNADCRVMHHNPVCMCRPGYTGDPLGACRPVPSKLAFICLYFLGIESGSVLHVLYLLSCCRGRKTPYSTVYPVALRTI